MKVLITSAWYPSKKNRISGIFVQEYAKAISLYNEVKVLLPPEEIQNLSKNIIIKENKENRIDVIRTYYKKKRLRIINSFLTYYSLFISVRKLIKQGWRPDLIHCNIFYSCSIFIPIKIIYSIPIIVSVHWSGILRKILNFKEKILLFIVVKFTSIVLPVSRHLKESISYYIKIESKNEIIYNTVDTKLFYKKKNNRLHKIKHFIAIGGLVEIKGFDKLIDAVSIISKRRKDFYLTIVGNGPLRDKLKNKIKILKLEKFITIKSGKSKKELSRLLDKNDFFVLSSNAETFGVVVIEAMAKGLPVIVTRCGGPEEFVKNFCGKVVKNNEPKNLAKAINYMLDNYRKYDINKISNYVNDNFSYEVIGGKFTEIYKKVVI